MKHKQQKEILRIWEIREKRAERESDELKSDLNQVTTKINESEARIVQLREEMINARKKVFEQLNATQLKGDIYSHIENENEMRQFLCDQLEDEASPLKWEQRKKNQKLSESLKDLEKLRVKSDEFRKYAKKLNREIETDPLD